MQGKTEIILLVSVITFGLLQLINVVSNSTAENFSCDVEPDGTILIRGITTTGEKIVCKYSQVFQMQTQNFCPTGHFSVSFQLPGPVNHQQFTSHFADGILEGIVKKR